MNTRLNNVMCRCCASEGTFKDLTSKYHWMGEEEIYADMLKDCFDIYLRSSEENEDGGICEVCITQLRNASNFKKQVLHTERIFKKQLQNKLFKEIVKVEVPEQDNLESDDDHNVTEDYSEFDMSIKEESPVESKAKKRVSSTTTSRAKKAKMEVGESSKRNLHSRTSNVVTSPEIVRIVKTHPNSILKDSSDVEPTTQKIEGNLQPRTSIMSKKTVNILKIQPKCNVADVNPTTVKIPIASNRAPKQDCTITETKKKLSKNVKTNKKSLSEFKKQLHNIEQILTHSNATPIRNHFGFYSCCYCQSEFEKPSDLKAHTLETHTEKKASVFQNKRLHEYVIKLDITGLKCVICQDNMNSLELLMDHINSNHDILIYKDIIDLIVPLKFESSQFQCYICLTYCYSFKSLLQHMNVHYQNYICHTCSSGFISLLGLRIHRKTHKKNTAKCVFCPLTFNDYRKKKDHEHLEHGAPLQSQLLYKCHYCNEAFKHYYSKEIHLRDVHGVKNLFECNTCGKTYNNKASYKSHLHRIHLSLKKHKCNVCTKMFSDPQLLMNHQAAHTKVECEICNKMYVSQKTMLAHLKTHVCKFKCDQCGSRFVLEKNYNAHLKNKHGDGDCA